MNTRRSLCCGLAVAALLALCYAERADLHRRITQALGGPQIAFVGDSITAGGDVWDWRLGRLTFDTANFGQGSAGIRVISWIARVRVIPLNHIKTVSIMAGTNDGDSQPLSFNGDDKAALAEYIDLIGYFEAHGVSKVVITSAFLQRLNTGLKRYVASDPKCAFIDLWPLLSNGVKLKPEMTTDGVHFSRAAYTIWSHELARDL